MRDLSGREATYRLDGLIWNLASMRFRAMAERKILEEWVVKSVTKPVLRAGFK